MDFKEVSTVRQDYKEITDKEKEYMEIETETKVPFCITCMWWDWEANKTFTVKKPYHTGRTGLKDLKHYQNKMKLVKKRPITKKIGKDYITTYFIDYECDEGHRKCLEVSKEIYDKLDSEGKIKKKR